MTAHLKEIRERLIRVIIVVGVTFAISFGLSEEIFRIIQAPIKNYELIFLSPTEAIFVHLKLSFFFALVLCIPYILYHIWEFVSPGLLPKERRHILPFVLFSTFFFALGVLFAYFLIIPFGIAVLMTYKTRALQPRISVGKYISFVFLLLFNFGVIFEMPPIVFFLSKIGLIKPSMLVKKRKYAIVIIFIMSAILTPPDVVTQLLMALPLIMLYEISIFVCRRVYRNKKT
ncbi:MAG: twin-arginine translocase subunit TatC [bacterium]